MGLNTKLADADTALIRVLVEALSHDAPTRARDLPSGWGWRSLLIAKARAGEAR